MNALRSLTLLLAAVAVVGGALAAAGGGFRDPLDAPAQPTRFASTTQLSAIARAGTRLVSVGARGLIVVSDDEGRSWSLKTAG